VIPATYPDKMELRTEVEENEVHVLVLESILSEDMVGTTAPTEVGCNEVIAIVGVSLDTEHVIMYRD
jgi:hypothetical protein